jgi:hypothetical protein
MIARHATLESTAGLRREIMEFAIASVAGHIRLAVIAVKLHATARVPVHFVQSHAKSVAIIQSVANCVMSLVHHAPRTAPGLAHIVGGALYHVRCLVTYYHAQSAVQIYWVVGIDAHLSVGRLAQVFSIVNYVRKHP